MDHLPPLPPDHRHRNYAGRLLTIQAAVAALVLALSLTPARGGTALMLPLPFQTTPALSVTWARAHGAAVLGPGPYAGSLLLRLPPSASAIDALSQGAVMLSLPSALCGTDRRR